MNCFFFIRENILDASLLPKKRYFLFLRAICTFFFNGLVGQFGVFVAVYGIYALKLIPAVFVMEMHTSLVICYETCQRLSENVKMLL